MFRNEKQTPRRRATGFTLVELMVVIVILALLIGILLPSFSAVRAAARDARVRARISELSSGAMAYKNDNGYYPGQRYSGELTTYTGSQVLGVSLFGYGYNQIELVATVPVEPRYAPVRADDLPWTDEEMAKYPAANGERRTTIDRFGGGNDRPILYYPSRLGVIGLSQYQQGDNDEYTGGLSWASPEGSATGQAGFQNYVKDRRFAGNASTTPYRDGEFLLIGAGVDRTFGTADDNHNW